MNHYARHQLEALAVANEKRLARAVLRRQITAGHTPITPLILDPPDELHTTNSRSGFTIADLLAWQHRWGQKRTIAFLNHLEISPTLPPQHLSPVNRKRLVEALEG